MISKFCFILFCFISTSLFSQKIPMVVKWGKEFQAPRRSTLADIIGYDETGFYVLKEKIGFGTATFSLEHFNHELASIKSVEVELTEKGNLHYNEFVLHLSNKLYLFTSFPDQKTKINTLSVQEVNKKALLPAATKRAIASINYQGKRKANRGDFNFRLSRDSSKLLIFYALPFSSKEPEKFGFHVFDKELNPLWNKEITLPYNDELFDIETFKVDNRGDVYLLGLIYKDVRKSKRRGAANYEYRVFSYHEKGTTGKDYSITLPDRFLTDMQIEVLENKDLICSGFYSEKGTFSIRGTYFLTIDAQSKQIKTKSFKEFDIDFITQNLKEGQAERLKKKEERGDNVELYEYDLDKLIVRSDGGALLIGEQYYITTSTYTTYVNGTPQTHSTTYYHYNDVIVVNINPKGNIEWAVKVPKRQVTASDGGFYSSYALAIVEDRIYIVYNDDPSNITYDGHGKVRAYNGGKDAIVMVAEINSEGKQIRQPVFTSATLDVITRPKVCEQISGHEMILFGQRKKTQQFARVNFK